MATGFCQAKTKNSKLRLAGFDNKWCHDNVSLMYHFRFKISNSLKCPTQFLGPMNVCYAASWIVAVRIDQSQKMLRYFADTSPALPWMLEQLSFLGHLALKWTPWCNLKEKGNLSNGVRVPVIYGNLLPISPTKS
jgi:hypothetical protein